MYYIKRNEDDQIEIVAADPEINEVLKGELIELESSIVVKRKELKAAKDEDEKEKKDKELKDLLKDHKKKQKDLEDDVAGQETLEEDDPEVLAFFEGMKKVKNESKLIKERIAKNNYEAAVAELKAEGALPADYPDEYPG